MFDAKLVEFELTLSGPVHEFDAGDGRRGSSKMCGFNSFSWGAFRLIGISCLFR